jgi:DNA-binding Xre family transcriptional regulator
MRMAMNEFQVALTNILSKRAMKMSNLVERTGYDPRLFEDIVTGKSRQIPVDFFVRIDRILDLAEEEKDALVRSWAFGVERWG